MPSATDADQDKMTQWFGSIMPEGPHIFLESHGYICDGGWQWKLPTPDHSVSCIEWDCIRFLIDEWDYGGIKNDNGRFTHCVCGHHAYYKGVV